MENEKRKIERATADLFLKLYNENMGSNFEIVKHGDAPDFICKDTITTTDLALEISLLQNIDGEIPYILGRGRQPVSPTTGTTAVSLYDDVYKEIERALKKKLRSHYPGNSALVLRQVSILWSPKDWELVAPSLRSTVLYGKENHFNFGIWIICTDDELWPAEDTLFRLV
jgi:hypothetical protein